MHNHTFKKKPMILKTDIGYESLLFTTNLNIPSNSILKNVIIKSNILIEIWWVSHRYIVSMLKLYPFQYILVKFPLSVILIALTFCSFPHYINILWWVFMLHIKDEIRFFRFTVLCIRYDFCFSLALTGDQIIFL